jgi:hypothetical protein
MKKIKYILKLYYVINHIIFNFLYKFNFLIRPMIKVGVKVKDDKYLGMERVIVKPKSSMNKPKLLYSQFQYSIIF